MDTTQNIVLNSVGAEMDPLTELRSRTNFGRPDFRRLFGGMRDGILDRTYIGGLDGSMRTTVGVYFCGPSAAGKLRLLSPSSPLSPSVSRYANKIYSA